MRSAVLLRKRNYELISVLQSVWYNLERFDMYFVQSTIFYLLLIVKREFRFEPRKDKNEIKKNIYIFIYNIYNFASRKIF